MGCLAEGLEAGGPAEVMAALDVMKVVNLEGVGLTGWVAWEEDHKVSSTNN